MLTFASHVPSAVDAIYTAWKPGSGVPQWQAVNVLAALFTLKRININNVINKHLCLIAYSEGLSHTRSC